MTSERGRSKIVERSEKIEIRERRVSSEKGEMCEDRQGREGRE